MILASLLLLSGVAIATYVSRQIPGTPTTKLHDLKWVEIDTPAVHSSEGFREMALALRDGTPMPSGYTLVEDWGRVIVRLGSYVDVSTGHHSATVIVIDDGDDLELVEILDASETVLESATSTNGGLIKSGGQVVATLPVLLNFSNYPAEYTVRMTSPPDASGERDVVSQTLMFDHQ